MYHFCHIERIKFKIDLLICRFFCERKDTSSIMGNFEPKKLDLIRIWEILKKLKISYCCVNIFVLIIRPCSTSCSWSGSNDNRLCVVIKEIIVILSDGF